MATDKKRILYVYVAITGMFLVAWNVFFGAGRVPQSTEEHVSRIGLLGVYVAVSGGFLWWFVRTKLDAVPSTADE